ncbi:nitroreductase [Companilactobacillus alimentarius]|uniref:nitroreductase n=1 Tax=Companilactobacillus alimentarius TaxID=1602 RepID=UPI0028B291B5|nr:nitroreductase [Companilactobacillus alimentarius]MDT6951406.1 nitroreductase [Companilactobacillus alimentarius]
METKEAILNRHSTRYFTDRKVDLKDIKEILTLAQAAPSWVNSQPEHIYLATGKTLETIRQGYLDKSSTSHGKPELPVLSRKDWSKQGQNNMASWSKGVSESLGSDWQEIMGSAATKLYNAQTILYLTLPKDYSLWSLYDLGAFGQTLVLSATDKHIASMTAYQLIKFPDVLRSALPISDDEVIISGIALGYRDDKALVNKISSNRQSLDQILTINND